MRWNQYFVVELVQMVKFWNHTLIKSSVTAACRQTILYVEMYQVVTLFSDDNGGSSCRSAFPLQDLLNMSVGMYSKVDGSLET